MNPWHTSVAHAVDMLGYAAAALVLLAFSLQSLIALRSVAIASNVMFVAYAIAAHLSPVLVLHAALLPVNLWRLWQSLRRDGEDRPVSTRAVDISPPRRRRHRLERRT